MPTERYLFAQVKAVKEDGTFEAVASTAALDRDNEIIDPAAWEAGLASYRANPVLMACHQHRLPSGSSPVIGQATRIEVVGGELQFSGKFARTALGQEYKTLYADGDMRAFSVGFIPQQGGLRELAGPDGKKRTTYVHTRCDLLEISCVPVPSNPETLARMRAAAAGERGESPEDAAGLKAAIEELKTEVRELKDLVCGLLPDNVNPPAPPARPASGGAGEDAGREAGRNAALADAASALRRAVT